MTAMGHEEEQVGRKDDDDVGLARVAGVVGDDVVGRGVVPVAEPDGGAGAYEYDGRDGIGGGLGGVLAGEARARTRLVPGERRGICRSRSSKHDRPNGIATA